MARTNEGTSKTVSGFSKLSKRGKIRWVVDHFSRDPEAVMRELISYWHGDEQQQRILDGFSENTLTNFPMPYGVAPNFLIDGRTYAVPMVIEESSVVAAASSAAKFWLHRGGFRTTILGTQKLGQVHLRWPGPEALLRQLWPRMKQQLRQTTAYITANMEKRGGGITSIELLQLPALGPDYYQIRVAFETCDSMGANFINSVLEQMAETFAQTLPVWMPTDQDAPDVEIIMAILSNYTPDCLVRAEVRCPVSQLEGVHTEMNGATFARRFVDALAIAHADPYRATTHNKGIFNGVDAVVLATGNDFRAVEACGHTYAARDGQYRSLSTATVEGGEFRCWLDLPLAIGAVGGLTKLHPIARRSLELLGQPTARELMSIIAATGLAQNFSAIRSLVTTGIQQGHMKMHLLNILQYLKASPAEVTSVQAYFEDKVVSMAAVRSYLGELRS